MSLPTSRIAYALDEIRTNGRNTFWWRQRFLTHAVSRYFRRVDDSADRPVHEADWDTLVILDACRYDAFQRAAAEHGLDGRLERRISRESGTPGFLRENFSDGQFHDTVYVTANAYVNTLLDDDTFHAVVPAWRDNWDDELNTVTPEAMGAACRAALEQYPNKRHVFHFVQPHEPFVGEQRLGVRDSALREKALGREAKAHAEREPTSFERLARGDLSKETVWSAYRSNLDRAMPVVHDLLDEIPGKTVVTADHGEAFGEFAWPFPIRVYGHPLGVLIPALTEVPWFVSEADERRDITSEPPRQREQFDDGTAAERLRMLGYVE
ncbi:hypothetical protein [Salinigranum halophilum]|uniref:hypothetical protein n=1 Tax=Salinigranum halophilum TaxID=2565931 RepID=UPI00115DB9D5|nr:hypothetical protein [Salinigranum halophilum]